MPTPVLTLIHDLADAIALADPEQVGLATVRLAEHVGAGAALAIAEALVRDVARVAELRRAVQPARCA